MPSDRQEPNTVLSSTEEVHVRTKDWEECLNGSLPICNDPSQPPKPTTPPVPSAVKRHNLHEIITSSVEVVGLFVLIVYTIFSCLQWLQIRWTNRLTREALNGSDHSLSQTLEKMQLQTDAMNRLADKAGLQADKLDASVRQATRLAEATEVANSNTYGAARPWIGGQSK